MEMERFNGRAKAENQGAVALVLDVAKAFERVSLPVVWAWATYFSFPGKILRVLCGYFEHQSKKRVMKKLKEEVEKKVSSFQSLKMARKERAR